jgi:hypothetical protein
MEGDSKYGHDKSSKNPNVQDDIFDVYTQSDAPVDYMKSHYIHHMTKLAKQYYNTQAIMEMDEYKNRGELEALYTVVTYEGKEELIEIGRGIFTKEMFVRSDPVVPEYA